MTTDYDVEDEESEDEPVEINYRHPDWLYVSRLLNELRWELTGLHTKVAEIEALRYYEKNPNLPPSERQTGQTVKSGLTDELLETIKAALLAGMPSIHVAGFRRKFGVEKNNSKRERFWQAWLESQLYPVNNISELADAQLLGLGVLKVARDMTKWSTKARRRKKNEASDDHVERVEALKKLWGPPLGAITVHPLAIFIRPAGGAKVEEVIEHSYKTKKSVIEQYGLSDAGKYQNMNFAALLPGQPDAYVRPLPQGVDTSNYFLITEYWNPDVYQVWVNSNLVFEESPPSVAYFIAPGRTTSSKDPDKYGQSVAENNRHNEPIIDRQLTRMVEAGDLIVNKRNTLEVPEGYNPEMDTADDGTTRPRTWTFRDDYAEALPPGAKIKDPFEGVEAIYAAMPLINLLFTISSQHSPSPTIKGISPGAAGSGYRDNSLYLMSKQQFEYIIASLQECIKQAIVWMEWCLVYCIKQEIFIGENSLAPSDIIDWPADISITLKPELPQNLIAEGQFWETQRQAGNVSRRFVREKLGIEQPDEMADEVDLERLKETLDPYIGMDAIASVLNKGPMAQQQGSGLVGPDGQTPISSSQSPFGPNNSTTTSGRMGESASQQLAGSATGGQPKSPTSEPGQFPPSNNELR